MVISILRWIKGGGNGGGNFDGRHCCVGGGARPNRVASEGALKSVQ